MVILAVVVVVALVVVTLMGDFLGLGAETSDRSSRIYWQNADVGIRDWLMIADGQDTLAVVNNVGYDIRLNNISIDGTSRSFNTTIRSGAESTLKKDWVSCDAGKGKATAWGRSPTLFMPDF